jgi:hypothetical protein
MVDGAIFAIAGMFLVNFMGCNLIYTYWKRIQQVEKQTDKELLQKELLQNGTIDPPNSYDLPVALMDNFSNTANTLSVTLSVVTVENNQSVEPNIYIFMVLFFNSVNWSVYAIWYDYQYIFLSDICSQIGSGLCIQVFSDNLTKTQKMRFSLVYAFFYAYFFMYILILKFGDFDVEIKNTIVNYSLTMNLLLFCIPLSNFAEIVKTSSTKTLYLPFTIVNFSSCVMWLCFGLSNKDVFQIAVYVIGTTLSVVELGLFAFYTDKMSIVRSVCKFL